MQSVTFRRVSANCLKDVESWHDDHRLKAAVRCNHSQPCNVIGPWQHLHHSRYPQIPFYYGYHLISSSCTVTIHQILYSSASTYFFYFPFFSIFSFSLFFFLILLLNYRLIGHWTHPCYIDFGDNNFSNVKYRNISLFFFLISHYISNGQS